MTTSCSVDQRRQLRAVDERGDLRLEARDVDRLGVAGRVVARLALELAVDRVLRGDLLDVAGLQLVDEERLVGHLPAPRPAREERQQEVEHQQPEEEGDERPAAGTSAASRAAAHPGRRVQALQRANPASRLRQPAGVVTTNQDLDWTPCRHARAIPTGAGLRSAVTRHRLRRIDVPVCGNVCGRLRRLDSLHAA